MWRKVMLLPDGPLNAVTEFAFIGDGGMPFVNAAKHEEVVARHVAKIERLREALGELDRAHHAYTHAALSGSMSVGFARSRLIETRERIRNLMEDE
jgi:hypothetical protein